MLHRWELPNWDVVDVRTVSNQIDRFRLNPTPISLLPASVNDPNCKVVLSTPRMTITYEGVVDGSGRPQGDDSAPTSPTVVSSKLIITKDGCVGQMTTDGFFVFEYRLFDGRIIDLRSTQLLIPVKSTDDLSLLLDINGRTGFMAHLEGSTVLLRDLHRVGAPKFATIELSTTPSAISWISEGVLAIIDLTTFRLYDSHGESLHRIEFPSTLNISHICSVLAGSKSISLLALVNSSNGEQFFLKYKFARDTITCGSRAKLAFLESSGQLLHLRISRGLFSAQAAEDDATVINIRDHSFLWEVIDVPFDEYLQGSLNGPIRKVVVDPAGECVAVAGRLGFCLCNMVQRKWKMFNDISEERDLIVDHLAWIECSEGTVLAVSGTMLSTNQNEFWIVSPKKDISKRHLLHRQSVSKRVVALNSCGPSKLGILSGEFVLQIVQLDLKDEQLSLNILMSASLVSFADSCLDPSAWKFSFIQDIFYQNQRINLFLVQRGEVLFSVIVPPQGGQDHRDIAAKIIKPSHVDDFFVWQPAGQLWIIILSGRRAHCHRWPFFEVGEFTVDFERRPVAFYPALAGGLFVIMEQSTHLGWTERNLEKISINQTVSLIPAFLSQQLHDHTDIEFSETAKTISRSFGDDHSGEFKLLIEMLLVDILTTKGVDEQRFLYSRLVDVLGSVLGPRTFRECLANFLRRIEIGDAHRVLAILGPYNNVFKVSIDCYILMICRLQSRPAKLMLHGASFVFSMRKYMVRRNSISLTDLKIS